MARKIKSKEDRQAIMQHLKSMPKKDRQIIMQHLQLINVVAAYIFMRVLALEAEEQYKKLSKKERQKTTLNKFVKRYIKNFKVVEK